jgi:hypothetical protein
MSEITLNDDQARILARAEQVVVVRDLRGNVIGHLERTKAQDDSAIVIEAQRRLATDQPRYTTAEVVKHLNSLQPDQQD